MIRIEINTKERLIRIDTGLRALNAWDESKHKRDKDGKFAESGADRAHFDKGSAKTADILGKEYTGVKGQAAVDLLMKEKQGYVKDAFMRKDIGGISLIWGNDDMGLQHIVKRRKETKQPLGKLLSSLTEVIEKGELTFAKKGRFEINFKQKKAIIEPKMNGEEFQFVFTAYHT